MRSRWLLATALAVMPFGLVALTLPHVFQNDTVADADAVNENFALVAAAIDARGVPSGAILMWSGSIGSIPAGWVLCDGTNNTPDLRNRFVVGAGTSYAVGATGGEATHVLTVAELPSHDHGGSTGNDSPDHSHVIPVRTGADDNNHDSGNNAYRYPAAQDIPSGPSHAINHTYGASNRHQHSIPAQGGGAAFENRPPYYALAYIMKL